MKRFASAPWALVALFAIFWIGSAWSPFLPEVKRFLNRMQPWMLMMIALILMGGLTHDFFNHVLSIGKAIWRGALAVLMLIASIVFIVPVGIANTFLLGPLSSWLWKYKVDSMVVLILSMIAVSIIFWYEGNLSYTFMKKLLIGFIVMGFAQILGGYAYDALSNTRRLVFTVKPPSGSYPYYSRPDPVESVVLKKGDRVVYNASGVVDDKSIVGDISSLLPYGDWYHPQGEMVFGIVGRSAVSWIFGTEVQSGPTEILETDITGFVGYNMSGEFTAPEMGRLILGFFDYNPTMGSVRLTIRINPERSLVGRTKNRLTGESKLLTAAEMAWLIRGVILLVVVGMLINSVATGGYSEEGHLANLTGTILRCGVLVLCLMFFEWIFYDRGGIKTALGVIKNVFSR
jgi:hypothetical protein